MLQVRMVGHSMVVGVRIAGLFQLVRVCRLLQGYGL